MSNLNIEHIISLDSPQLQPYRTLRRPQDHLDQGIFVAEGEKVVRRFLDSDWKVISLLLTPEWLEAIVPSTTESRLRAAQIFVGGKNLLETIVGFPLHQGIMAVGEVPREASLEATIQRLPSPHFLVALDGLVHAENVGVVVRNCAGFGVDGILIGKTTASPYLRRAVRNSMGGIFKLPCKHVDDLAVSLAWLKNNYATRIIIADAHAETTVDRANFSGNICIVFGNEDAGVSEEVNAIATDRVRIPMHNSTDSLNVASASAVVLWEGRRGR
ncbi:MAG: RNA methyltransferase [Bacteroidetes bacterium]|nr:RNA methyltransferase [Bacteroidota bacterium]MCW5896824.1 RNA methyltransferase [Bacteroidota bacterium]